MQQQDALSAILAAIFIGILLLAMIGLGWETFFSGIARGAQKVVDNPLVDEAKEYLDDFGGNDTKRGT
jgi:hypothetical protein